MEKIIGLIDAPFTPFYENGEVNYEPIEAYCQLLVKNGLQGVFINGWKLLLKVLKLSYTWVALV